MLIPQAATLWAGRRHPVDGLCPLRSREEFGCAQER
jgi:hypothetical protein